MRSTVQITLLIVTLVSSLQAVEQALKQAALNSHNSEESTRAEKGNFNHFN
jgi:hypothetical protein